jgi:hypothetical protein
MRNAMDSLNGDLEVWLERGNVRMAVIVNCAEIASPARFFFLENLTIDIIKLVLTYRHNGLP